MVDTLIPVARWNSIFDPSKPTNAASTSCLGVFISSTTRSAAQWLSTLLRSGPRIPTLREKTAPCRNCLPIPRACRFRSRRAYFARLAFWRCTEKSSLDHSSPRRRLRLCDLQPGDSFLGVALWRLSANVLHVGFERRLAARTLHLRDVGEASRALVVPV